MLSNQLTLSVTGDAKASRDEIYDGEPHQSKISHELVAGGAAFEAMKLFEDRQRANGTIHISLRSNVPPWTTDQSS
jgi:hypothetical protein